MEDRIKYAFQLPLQRTSTDTEIRACQFLLQHAGWTELCRVLLNTNEFAYID
jgi:hypothetical protein